MATIQVMRTAGREWPCAYGKAPIKPGERYVDEVMTPWERVVVDVDDDGRPLAEPSGQWTHVRYHPGCRVAAEYGWPEGDDDAST